MALHSDFPASGAKRLIECPGSYRLTRSLPAVAGGVPRTSVYAAEGTAAHVLAEVCLRTDAAVEDRLGVTINADGMDFVVDEDMVEHVSTYVEYVRSLNALGYDIWLERKVSPISPWTPDDPPIELFGTADCIAVHWLFRLIEIVDLKYGRGVLVDVRDNPQLLYYGQGTLDFLFDELPLPDLPGSKDPASHQSLNNRLTTTLIQPRAPHPDGPIRVQHYNQDQITQWGKQILRPAVDRVLLPGAPLRVGDHCQFCPALPYCPEYQKTAQDKARDVFDNDLDALPAPVAELDAGRLGDDLLLADRLEGWIAAVRQEAHLRLEHGEPVPHYKLVAKRATRRWKDEQATLAAMVKAGYGKLLTRQVLLTPAQAVKAAKSSDSDTLLEELTEQIVAVSSGTTLARDTDPRTAVPGRPTAAQVFDAVLLPPPNPGEQK